MPRALGGVKSRENFFFRYFAPNDSRWSKNHVPRSRRRQKSRNFFFFFFAPNHSRWSKNQVPHTQRCQKSQNFFFSLQITPDGLKTMPHAPGGVKSREQFFFHFFAPNDSRWSKNHATRSRRRQKLRKFFFFVFSLQMTPDGLKTMSRAPRGVKSRKKIFFGFFASNHSRWSKNHVPRTRRHQKSTKNFL
jgi:hypothetical protein